MNRVLPCALAALAAVSAARAEYFEFNRTVGSRAALVRFERSGPDLVITLWNVSTNDVTDGADVLTGVLFDLDGISSPLTRMSAGLGAGSSVLFASAGGSSTLASQWGFSGSSSSAPAGSPFALGVLSSGLVTDSDRFAPGSGSLGGVGYGLTSIGDNSTTGDAGVTGTTPIVQSAAVFVLSNIPADFNPGLQVRNIQFHYSEGNDGGPTFPSPGAGALFLAALGVLGRRRR